MSLAISVGARTDVGLRRNANEDSFLVAHPVYAVADGMGGHDAGDLASRAVVAALAELGGREGLTTEDVAIAVGDAHHLVRTIADASARGAGSTVTGAVVVEQDGRPHWLVFNVGDSRVYRWSDGRLTQLTVDHSIAQRLVDEGSLAREDMSTYTGRNVITKAVGADDSDADFWLHPVLAGESLLLCSDGLSGEVSEQDIAHALAAAADPQELAESLVEAALAAGGRDNVTVVVLRVDSGGSDPALDESTGSVQRLVRPQPEPDDLDESTIEIPKASRS